MMGTVQTGIHAVPSTAGASRSLPAINLQVAGRLRDYADLLVQQGEGRFRAKAFRWAAVVIATFDQILLQDGREGLIALPAVGMGIAGAIAEMVSTGRWSQLDRLRGELAPEVLFRSTPGIGARLARRLAAEGQIERLEELEHAVRFGKLHVKGLGPRRMRMIAAAIAEGLGVPTLPRRTIPARPPVSQLLQVDRIYRERASAGQLRKIAPKRFNPAGDAWLPILHARHGDCISPLCSQTASSRTGFIRRPTGSSSTITRTACLVSSGSWLGKRIIRGRESAEDEEEISNETRNRQ
ncbi:DNA-binding protein [Mesorhizobium silamurunense]|uniref:DNA-binding protein n=1 Tax=Mesorhizobium silamurunense TaxID=499528 RepID=UPI001AEE4456|nr:DNA-binding protein [Mesorhizobium silamurunense]